MTTQPLHCL